MNCRKSWGLFLRLALMLLVLSAPAGLRASGPFQETHPDTATQFENCVATGSSARDLQIAIATSQWECGEDKYSLDAERSILRFELDSAIVAPRYLISRRNPLDTIHIIAEDVGGTRRNVSYSYDEILPALEGNAFKAPLPKITPDTRTVYVAFDLPTHVMTLQHAHLALSEPGADTAGQDLLLLLAGLCGMLLMPLVLNVAFYRILREPFVLWHAALTVSLMLTIVYNSGLSISLLDLSPSMLSKWTTIVFGLSVASGGMFAHSFIEPGLLHPAIRKALPWAAIWSLVVSFGHANFPFFGRVWQTDVYYLCYLPVLILYIALLVDALRRGSRAAKYQLVGWLPLLIVGATRISSQILPGMAPTDAMLLFYLGCVLEVLATTMGVADRFMALKDQRDRAQTEAHMLELLTEHDTLTGLNNRRVLEERFDTLRTQGFTVMAVLDLDHFKKVNDTFGHGVGDDVLRAVARALKPDSETVVVRMGGEEFVILLRGRDALERAERRRVAIPRHVADEVQIDRLVTASMGIVDAPLDAMPKADFDTLYRRADRLLYEAKQAGRNRLMSERLQAFGGGKANRRKKPDRRVA